jgi:hypothetical protein
MRGLETSFAKMTDLPAEYRAMLEAETETSSMRSALVQESATDHTRKFLFELGDGAKVESVLMRYEHRTTLCVSSQVGCPLDCIFCETARAPSSATSPRERFSIRSARSSRGRRAGPEDQRSVHGDGRTASQSR